MDERQLEYTLDVTTFCINILSTDEFGCCIKVPLQAELSELKFSKWWSLFFKKCEVEMSQKLEIVTM